MKTTIIISILLIIASCKSQEISKTDYKLVNIVVDSLVKQSRKDTIGLKLETLNNRLKEEIVLDLGFQKYENEKFITECPGSEIRDSLYTKFNYEKFISKSQSWKVKKITNPKVLTDFTLKREPYIKRYNQYVALSPESDKQEIKEYIWSSERAIGVRSISTPIYADDKKIVIIFVYYYSGGLQSWQLRKKKNGTWYISCTKQIWIE